MDPWPMIATRLPVNADLFQRVEHTGQRLQPDRQLGAERRVVRHQTVSIGPHDVHQPVECRGPSHHLVPTAWSG
jgi:hypothetical protein